MSISAIAGGASGTGAGSSAGASSQLASLKTQETELAAKVASVKKDKTLTCSEQDTELAALALQKAQLDAQIATLEAAKSGKSGVDPAAAPVKRDSDASAATDPGRVHVIA